MKCSSRWVKHFKSKEEKEKFKERLAGSKEILDALTKILEEDYQASLGRSQATDAYKLPSWALFQADQIAEQRTLRNIMSLMRL